MADSHSNKLATEFIHKIIIKASFSICSENVKFALRWPSFRRISLRAKLQLFGLNSTGNNRSSIISFLNQYNSLRKYFPTYLLYLFFFFYLALCNELFICRKWFCHKNKMHLQCLSDCNRQGRMFFTTYLDFHLEYLFWTKVQNIIYKRVKLYLLSNQCLCRK